MTLPTTSQQPFEVRERPPFMIGILGASLLAIAGGAVGAYLAGAPRFVVGVLGAASVLMVVVFRAFTSLTLRVNDDGLYVTWGGIFFKRLRPEEIDHAESGPYQWVRFGGWGWRFSLRGDQAFSYPFNHGALIVHRDNGRTLVVTLRDPAAAAKAVNALTKVPRAAAR